MKRQLAWQYLAALTIGIALLGGGVAIAQDGAKTVEDAATLKTMFLDRTMYGYYPADGSKWSEYYCPSGYTAYVVGDALMSGRWWIENNSACFSYDPPGHDKHQCYAVSQTPDGSLRMHADVIVDDAFVSDVVISGTLPGDTFHMLQLAGTGCNDLSS